jgi:hypothetical protein
MRTHRPLVLLVGSVLLVVLATGVVAAESGDGGSVVGLLDQLIERLRAVLKFLESVASMPSLG